MVKLLLPAPQVLAKSCIHRHDHELIYSAGMSEALSSSATIIEMAAGSNRATAATGCAPAAKLSIAATRPTAAIRHTGVPRTNSSSRVFQSPAIRLGRISRGKGALARWLGQRAIRGAKWITKIIIQRFLSLSMPQTWRTVLHGFRRGRVKEFTKTPYNVCRENCARQSPAALPTPGPAPTRETMVCRARQIAT